MHREITEHHDDNVQGLGILRIFSCALLKGIDGLTFKRSTNSVHALLAHRRKFRRELLPSPRAAFIIQSFSSSSVVVDLDLEDCAMLGISCTEDRNSGASEYGTAKASVESCDIDASGLAVTGKDFAVRSLGIGTMSAVGAVCGPLLELESGKTKVRSARWSVVFSI